MHATNVARTISCLMAMQLFGCTVVYSQSQLGVKGGLNISDIAITNLVDPDSESDFDLKAGIHAGAFFITDVHERFSLAAELLYSNKGVKAITAINFHYINIPLLVQYKVSDKFRLEGGPELGYMIAATSKHGNISTIWDNKFDVGLDAGIQYRFTPEVFISIRYNAGFSSVTEPLRLRDSNNQPMGEAVKYQNRVLQVSLAYVIKEIKD